MTGESMERRQILRQVFCDCLDLDAGVSVETLTYRSVPAWDSVGHMRLVAALETAFDIMLDTDEVIDLSSFDKAWEILSRHLGGG